MKPLIVLAGGFGTRLRSMVCDVPKPLAPVDGKPFISYIIENWVSQGVSDFIFLLHYEAEKIKLILNNLSARKDFSNITFKTLVENKPLGTGGAILNAIEYFNIRQSFLAANADTWLDSGIDLLVNSEISTIAAVELSSTDRYGFLEFEGDKIYAFREKYESKGSGCINSGLYHLLPEDFHGFVLGSNFSLETDVFPRLVARERMGVIKVNGVFIDIGIPEDYVRFCKWIESGKRNEI